MKEYAPVATMTNWPAFRGEAAACTRVRPETGWEDFSEQAERPSLLIFADPGPGRPEPEDAAAMAALLGMRLLGHVPIRAAGERLSQLVDVDAVLVQCSGNEPGLDLVLARLDTMAGGHGVALILIVDMDGLDHVHAIIGAGDATILCQPDPGDVVAALALAASRNRDRQWLHDIGRESSDSRIDKLSDELVRLSRTIEALVHNRMPSQFVPAPGDGGDFLFHSPERSFAAWPGEGARRSQSSLGAAQVRAVLRSRRLRDHIFASDLFADPAWDIVLDLMAARLEGTKVSVSSLCIAAAVPPTTALRWIRQLTERGLLMRQADPNDGRRIFIALSEKGVELVARWFDESRSSFQLMSGQAGDGKDGLRSLI